MDIFDKAMQFEKAGALLYRRMARRAPERGLKGILNWLAAQEDKHFDIIRRMKVRGTAAAGRRVNWKGVTKIFKRMKSVAANLDFAASQADIYRKALKVEKKSVAFYSSRAGKIKDVDTVRVLARLAIEEKRHVTIIKNLIEFVTEPESWAEDAEFHRLGQY